MSEFHSKIKTVEWVKTGELEGISRMVDQTLIPYEYKKIDIKTTKQMYDAIKTMIVRGAPAIGISGAHGVALCAIELLKKNEENFVEEIKKGKVFETVITATNKGGLTGQYGSYQVFVPSSQIKIGFVKDLEKYVGKTCHGFNHKNNDGHHRP